MQVLLSQRQLLSTRPGIYLFLDEKGEILYVGKAKNLKKRVASYFAKYVTLGTKTQALVSKIKRIKTIIAKSEIEALLLEANLIKKYKPKYNIRLTDGKNYPLIRITAKDKYPKILIARQAFDLRSIYFGPFPNSTAMKLVLRIIRRIFPYQSVLNHPKKLCLYYHLDLCPCPPVFDSLEYRREYKKTIKHIVDFLNGNTKKIIRDLLQERDLLSKVEEFEKANLIQKKIDAIKLIANPVYNQFDYRVNINLEQDISSVPLSSLRYLLWQNGLNVKKLERIECFDISNISGTNATGSMVVFSNGKRDSSAYRRFKIKNTPNLANDFAMMQEILSRRLNHREWPIPNLIIVDGGKGQVSSVLKVLREIGKNIPLVGLAKREETIVTSDFKEISLPKDSDALKLIMRIRDEAHRFAITYHRKLRSKNFLN